MSRKQVQPRRGAQPPRRVDEAALTLRWTPDGAHAAQVIDLTQWAAGDAIKREVLCALKVLTGRDGDWRSRATVRVRLVDAKALVEWCGAQGIDSFADLTLTGLQTFLDVEEGRLNARGSWFRRMGLRVLLRHVPERSPTLAMWLNERQGVPPAPDMSRTDYYTRAEFEAIEQAAAVTVSRARARVQTWMGHMRRIEEMGPDGHVDEVRMRFWRREPVSPHERRRWLGKPDPVAGRSVMWSHFFTLTSDEVVAAAVLLVCRNGWNLEPLLRMTSGSTKSAEDEEGIYAVDADKPRQGGRRHSRLVMVDHGLTSNGAAWRQVIEATQPARDWLAVNGHAVEDLLLYSSRGKESDGGDGRGSRTVLLPVRQGLPRSDQTRPDWVPDGLNIDFPRLRRTHQSLIRREPNQNTLRTHVEKYLMANPEVRAEMDAEIAAAQMERLERAEETVLLRLSDPSEVPSAIADGSQDTATAACRNIERHPETGRPCAESFFACLRCSNAVATERHLPRLALLHRALEDRRTTASEQVWQRWREDYVTLTAFLFHIVGLSEEAYRRRIASANASDQQMVRALLNGDLDATA